MMSWPHWLEQWLARHPSDIHTRIAHLELQLDQLKQQRSKESPGEMEPPRERETPPTIVIENVSIAHLHIDKLEHSTNFGALGIKDLGGKLNIGVNYTGPIGGETWEQWLSEVKKEASGQPEPAEGKEQEMRASAGQPTCNIRPKAL
ncbi:hypothetical protein [Paenibacillus cremeus]|uniref:Uncharacterized protein n=1 Tax=Paenibacillus cremeus TaxID=2163881 RepID=A0A559KDS5_9BACL|nr:hypothetical protein [Paenibacillus cremeus]TVY10264.1 hypothetical protein FPZ49_09370 [Paenibacillus cremeus]